MIKRHEYTSKELSGLTYEESQMKQSNVDDTILNGDTVLIQVSIDTGSGKYVGSTRPAIFVNGDGVKGQNNGRSFVVYIDDTPGWDEWWTIKKQCLSVYRHSGGMVCIPKKNSSGDFYVDASYMVWNKEQPTKMTLEKLNTLLKKELGFTVELTDYTHDDE